MGDMEAQVTEVMLNKGSPPREEGSKVPQYLFTIAATMSAFCAGTALAWTGPALEFIVARNTTSINGTVNNTVDNVTDIISPAFTITSDEGSWVGSLLAVGALIGALPVGIFANLFGRKLVCASLALPFIASWLIIVYASSAEALYVARFIMGIATGASSAIAPMYVGEIAENSVRGSLGSFFQLMLTVGILYTYVLGACVDYTTLAVLSGIVPIIFLLAFFNAPETPVYLLSKGLRKEAEASLKRLRGASYNVSYELNDLQKEIDRTAANKASFGDLFTRKAALRALVICLGLMFFQQLSGVNAVIFYANSIFKDAGSTLSPAISAIIIGVIQVVVTYVSSILVDKAGRRILLLISAAVMAACQGMLGYYFYLKQSGSDVSSLAMIPLGSVALFIVIFSLGFGPIPWMMAGEVFTSDLKGPAASLAVGLNWLLAFLVTKMFAPLKEILGMGATFGIFGVICAVGVAFVFLLVPETKGKSMDEIQRILAGNKK